MSFAPSESSYRGVWQKIMRPILFWSLMIFLAFAWLRMHGMGRGTRLNNVIGFAPLVMVVILFLFVLAVDRALKRRERGEK